MGYSAYSSPLMVNHHLQPAKWHIPCLIQELSGNQSFIDGFQKLTDSGTLTTFRLRDYQYDVWIQDEIDSPFSILRFKIDVVIDSIRDRGLMTFQKTIWRSRIHLLQHGVLAGQPLKMLWEFRGISPITVDGTEYPFVVHITGVGITRDYTQK